MAIVTDPDSLDRFQVLVDYVNQKIGVKPVKTSDPKSDINTDGIVTSGSTFFEDASANFTTSGVASGDILVIVEGENIGYHTITGITDTDKVGTFTTFYVESAATETDISYGIFLPTGGTLADGATLQSIYSFLKEEWRTQQAGMPDLIKHTFPLESITREQFEIGGTTHENWDWLDDDSRNLIRTGGWAQINNTGLTETRYAGIITLGSIDSDAQVYYLQSAAGTPSNFVLTGPVNQAVKVFDSSGSDDRTFLKLFVRKKARSYAQSEIADIGVSTIETIVNRFPLAHATDPAITSTDGDLIGTSPFQSVAFVGGSATGGAVTSSTASAVEKTFTFTDATAAFIADGLKPKDSVFIKDVNNTGRYEIVTVDGEQQLTLLQEPNVAITTDSSMEYETFTRIRSAEKTDGDVQSLGTPNTTGLLRSNSATFITDNVTGNDILAITTGNNSLVGVYKVSSIVSETGILINTTDQAFIDASGLTFTVLRPGMHLQFKSVDATQVLGSTGTIDFLDTDPDTLTRHEGNFTSDGFVHGMALTVASAETSANDGDFIIDTVASGTMTLITEEALTADLADVTATLDGNVGVVRTLNAVDYPFNWRMFGNNGTLSQCFQWVQKELRRTTDVDSSEQTQRGDITDLLMAFSTPTATTTNMVIDDIASADLNNLTQKDITGDSRNFAFIAGITVNLNANILDSSSTKVVMFFTNDDAGDDTARDFGTDDAIVINDKDGVAMQDTNPASSPLTFSYDYDNNDQRGTASKNTDAPVTIVAIGTDTAQYVQIAGTITRQSSNIFSIVAALERNYANA